jgi:FMN reductase
MIAHIDTNRSRRGARGNDIVGFCGSPQRPSRSRSLVEIVVDRASTRYGLPGKVLDVSDVFPELGATTGFDIPEKVARVIDVIQNARALVVGTPVYKGSYTGLFKHFFDLIEPNALAGLPVVITATGGGDRHALVVEHQLRPLFAFFTAHCAPNAIYASTRDFAEGRLISDAISERVDCAINDLAPWLELATPAGIEAVP